MIRPAAAEWDEREQIPWPILQEAAKIGLYSLDFLAAQFFEESGLGIPVAFEELFWGDAGIGLSLVGQRAGRHRGRLQRDARAGRGVAAADVRHARRRQAGRVLLVGAGRGQRRGRDPHPGGLRREDRRVGHQRRQDLGDQRRHRQRARRRRLGRPVARLARAGDASSCRPARRACRWGRSSASTASGPRTRPRSSSTTSGCPAAAWSAARRSSTTGWPGSARAAAAASRRR